MAPLYAKSKARIMEVCKRYGVQTPRPGIHVTIAEAIDPMEDTPRRQELMNSIIQDLWINNRLRVTGYECIPTINETNRLVTLRLKWSSAGEAMMDAIRQLQGMCKFAQYPMHCAVGVTSSENVSSLATGSFVSECQTLELYLNPFCLAELPPTNGQSPTNETEVRTMAEALCVEPPLPVAATVQNL